MSYDSELTPHIYKSSLPGKFPDIENCLVRSDFFDTQLGCWHVPDHDVRYGLLVPAGEALRPGFPSLHHVTHRAKLEQRSVKVFQQASRGANMIMYIGTHVPDSPYSQSLPNKIITDLCQDMLGLIIAVGWPHCYGAKVIEISSRKER